MVRSDGIGSRCWVLLVSFGYVLNWLLDTILDDDHHDEVSFSLVIQMLGDRTDCLGEDGCIDFYVVARLMFHMEDREKA